MAFVNKITGYNGANDTTVSATINATAGNLLIVKVTGQEWGFSGATVSISDTAGNTWNTNASMTMVDAGTGPGVQIFYAYNISGNASNVVTATFTAANRYKSICVEQFSSMDTTSGVLITQNEASGSGLTTINSGNLVTSTDSVLSAVACSSNDRTWTPDTGFTESLDTSVDHSASTGHAQYKEQTGGGTYSVTSTASASSNLVIAAAAFKVAAAGSSIAAIANHLKQQGIS